MADSVEKLREIYAEFSSLCIKRGAEVSEADTRATVIDRILHEVLGWGHQNVHREVATNPGFLDYELTEGRPRIVVEAKNATKSFSMPYKKNSPKRLKISGILSTNKELIKAVEQTQQYCNSRGIRFGVTTNGYCFIVFRAIAEGMSWKDGQAVIFDGPKDIESRFNEFSNLLSYDAVVAGKIANIFTLKPVEEREFHRPIDLIFDPSATYARNKLNIRLRPYVEKFFGDIAAQDDITVLEKCYIDSTPLQVIDEGLNIVIRDKVPSFIATAKQIESEQKGKQFGLKQDFVNIINSKKVAGSVALIVGGIGSGKTTLLRRFFRIVAPDLFTDNGVGVDMPIDFLGMTNTPEEVNIYTWKILKKILISKFPNLTNRQTLEEMFKDNLNLIKEVYSDKANEKVSDKLVELASNNKEFCKASIRYCVQIGKLPVVIFDNVDQLGVNAQIEIFTQAQHLAREYGCISLVVLREETYSTAQMKKQLTAYNIQAYHLSSPQFRKLVKSRIDTAIKTAEAEQREKMLTGGGYKTQQVIDFFRLLNQSVFERNRNIVKLVEAVSYGNARLALDFLNSFMISGATNMQKILDIFNLYGDYTIPFHEFSKSVILGDYCFYKESRSRIFNIFNVSTARNASHFTALRILNYLSKSKHSNQDSDGFVSLHVLLTNIIDIFDNEEDCMLSITRLICLNDQLAELDSRQTETVEGASSIRITSAGMYYLHFFVNSFQYLDLIWHDIPFNNSQIARLLSNQMHSTDMQDRFWRTEKFLEYLTIEENNELAQTTLPYGDSQLLGPFMPYINQRYNEEKTLIIKKLKK